MVQRRWLGLLAKSTGPRVVEEELADDLEAFQCKSYETMHVRINLLVGVTMPRISLAQV